MIHQQQTPTIHVGKANLDRQANRIRNRMFGGFVMAIFGAVAFVAPVFAATFTQSNVYFTNSWESDNPYSSSAGGHQVSATMLCDTASTPTVELVQDFWFEPNTYLGQKALACNNTKRVTWSSDDDGDHFLLFRYEGSATISTFSWTYPF